MFQIIGNLTVSHNIVHKQPELAYKSNQATVIVLSHNSDIAGFLSYIRLGNRLVIHTRPQNISELPAIGDFVEIYRVGNVAMYVAPGHRNRGGMNLLFDSLLQEAKATNITRIDLIDMKEYWLINKLQTLLQKAGYSNIGYIMSDGGEGNLSLVAKL